MANISRIKVVERFPETGKGKQQEDKKVDMAGLSFVACCSNEKCVNYEQDVEIDIGFGTFPILELTAFSKCEVCPYRSQKLRPNMMCKQVKVNHCYYRLTGKEMGLGGIPVWRDSGFFQAKTEKRLSNFLKKHPWHLDMQLTVKPL